MSCVSLDTAQHENIGVPGFANGMYALHLHGRYLLCKENVYGSISYSFLRVCV